MPRTLEEKIKSKYLVFVLLVTDESPRYFIAKKDDVIKIVKEGLKEWIKTARHKKTIEELMKAKGPQFVYAKYLEKYGCEDNWNVLFNELETEPEI